MVFLKIPNVPLGTVFAETVTNMWPAAYGSYTTIVNYLLIAWEYGKCLEEENFCSFIDK